MAININSTTPMLGVIIHTDMGLRMRVWLMHGSEDDGLMWLAAATDGSKWNRLSDAEGKQLDFELLRQAVKLPAASLWSRLMAWVRTHTGGTA